MKRIDQATVQRILDAADIVEVVSDFVSLKRRGANYIGLCPFHNERTPSFSVSKSKGICKCFSCGKGGSPVNFIMEHEQMSFNEALRYLARKYNIEIVEQEMTSEERERESDRESMFALNEWAMAHYEKILTDTADGRDIGLSYFRHRGISDAMIKKFHLGYALEENDELYQSAIRNGFSEKYLLSTGLCIRNDKGRIYDRFRGRVIYPVQTISGKVVAFGGRTLKTDKSMAKYVNSPESDIYLKRKVLYGLYQAKQSIVKADRCILVEGYMDVISMHQSGITNVVASSGTSLTTEQIRLIHRFTENVTVIYDSDAAGIKASIRGIDMLLAEGLNVKVVLFPDGDDPDSFAQSHTSEETEKYLADNSTDFIRFKTRIMMDGVADDPVRRSEAITEIVRSIAYIPSEIKRNVYVQECARDFGMDEKVLQRQVAKFYEANLAKAGETEQKQRENTDLDRRETPSPAVPASTVSSPGSYDPAAFLRPHEIGLLKLALKYGQLPFCEMVDENGQSSMVTVLHYIANELTADEISLSNPDCAMLLDQALGMTGESWLRDYEAKCHELEAVRAEQFAQGLEEIRNKATDIGSINAMEGQLQERVDAAFHEALDSWSAGYIAQPLLSSPDEAVRRLATDLVVEKYQLSKIHTKFAHIETEQEQLLDLVPRKLFELKNAILNLRIKDIKVRIAALSTSSNSSDNFDEMMSLLKEQKQLEDLRKELAKLIGDRVIAPSK
ncbi:MAG: DNA primase [Lachnoclostridium sp.]|nr:DNA primase [Lachnoclostridium sp.]